MRGLRILCKGVLALFVLFFVGFLFIPRISDAIDEAADASQGKCSKMGKPNDPLGVSRPAYPGQVLRVRLTNAGELVDRCELTDVLYELNWDYERCFTEFRPDERPGAIRRPKLVVLYVHGWKHNADAKNNGSKKNDDDLDSFGKLIATLSTANDDKQVLGVYVGWNAKPRMFPFTLPLLEDLTFWSKKGVADRIAQSTILTKIIGSISSVLSQSPYGTDQFITIGHSFGARILFSATGQSLIHATEHGHPGFPGGTYKRIEGPADAVILLNPAFEASLFTALHGLSRHEEAFSDQLPLLLSVASRGDKATRNAFPIGQWFDFLRSPREMTTLGNYREYQTHVLFSANNVQCGPSSTISEVFFAHGLCLSRIPTTPYLGLARSIPHNPFLIAGTFEDVIENHNDIWREPFSSWLFSFVNALQAQKSSQTMNSETRVIERNRCQY